MQGHRLKKVGIYPKKYKSFTNRLQIVYNSFKNSSYLCTKFSGRLLADAENYYEICMQVEYLE